VEGCSVRIRLGFCMCMSMMMVMCGRMLKDVEGCLRRCKGVKVLRCEGVKV